MEFTAGYSVGEYLRAIRQCYMGIALTHVILNAIDGFDETVVVTALEMVVVSL